MADMYDHLNIERQRAIVKKAKLKRKKLTSWQKAQVLKWDTLLKSKKTLTEQQLFFMIGIEAKLKVLEKK